MATKQQVIDLHRQNPTWTAPDIASALNCYSAYVRATAQRNGLKIPRSKVGAPLKTPAQMREKASEYERWAVDLRMRANALEAK